MLPLPVALSPRHDESPVVARCRVDRLGRRPLRRVEPASDLCRFGSRHLRTVGMRPAAAGAPRLAWVLARLCHAAGGDGGDVLAETPPMVILVTVFVKLLITTLPTMQFPAPIAVNAGKVTEVPLDVPVEPTD